MSMKWNPIATAPKDGTQLLLRVAIQRGSRNSHPMQDDTVVVTIGHNNVENDGEDQWLIAGWDWEQDHYTQGQGTPIEWMEMPSPPHIKERVETDIKEVKTKEIKLNVIFEGETSLKCITVNNDNIESLDRYQITSYLHNVYGRPVKFWEYV